VATGLRMVPATTGDSDELGAFLRARRELVRPEDVGIPARGLRRVAGLRREEVAMLAGISAEYYLRLEQGRDRNPSVQVLEALARVLQLDAESAAYLLELARPRPRRRTRRRAERVPAGTLMLIDTLPVPVFVVNRYRDVLAANRLAVALSPLMRPGTNRLIALFTDPGAADYHPDWERNAASIVAQLRAEVGTGTGLIRHPQVGDLQLRREKYAIVGAAGLQMVVYHAAPGSSSAERLPLLGSSTSFAARRSSSAGVTESTARLRGIST
jgi:transcriptional regulator with XRE-family HTH domain